MIDANRQIRKGYYQRLSAAVTVNSSDVPVYDSFAPNNASYPYIILSTQTSVDQSVKRCQGQECTMLVDVVTGMVGAVQRETLDYVCDQIFQLIYPMGGPGNIDVGPDLTLIKTRLVSDTTMEMQNDTYKVLRRLIRFTHTVHEQVNI